MLLFMDGQAHYDTARLPLKYSNVDSTGVTWDVVPEGRFGNCIRRSATGAGSASGFLTVAPLTTRLGVWTPNTGGVCGFAVKVTNLASAGPGGTGESPFDFFSIIEGGLFHLKVTLNPSGAFTLRGNLGGGSTDLILAQSPEGLSEGAWAFVECKWLLDSVAGTFEMRVNGLSMLNFTGNTIERSVFASTGVWQAIRLLGAGSAPAMPLLTVRMCDVYVADLASPSPADVHDFLGDGTIQTIRPDGPGASTLWTPSAGANWDATDDVIPDDDGSYVVAASVGQKDTYSFQDIPGGSIVKGAHVCILARKETEGVAAVAPVVHQGATDYLGPAQGVASLLYDRYLTQPFDFNPATGARFTAGEINGGQFGVVKVQ